MATIDVFAYPSAASLTITLTSLADAAYRQSTVVDNTSNEYIDAQIGGSIQVGASPVANESIYIFVYGSYDGTSYTAGCSGTDGAYTADGEEGLLKMLEEIVVDGTANQDYVWGPCSVAEKFGGVLPRKWGIVVKNDTGGALHATGTNNEVKYTGIKYTVA